MRDHGPHRCSDARPTALRGSAPRLVHAARGRSGLPPPWHERAARTRNERRAGRRCASSTPEPPPPPPAPPAHIGFRKARHSQRGSGVLRVSGSNCKRSACAHGRGWGHQRVADMLLGTHSMAREPQLKCASVAGDPAAECTPHATTRDHTGSHWLRSRTLSTRDQTRLRKRPQVSSLCAHDTRRPFAAYILPLGAWYTMCSSHGQMKGSQKRGQKSRRMRSETRKVAGPTTITERYWPPPGAPGGAGRPSLASSRS